jgi:phosphoribosylamine--glycine ligase
MKVLVVGSGGREHALVWKLAQSPRVTQLYAAPGNPGMTRLARCVSVAAEDIQGLAEFVAAQGIDLTVVGPEGPIASGLVDRFAERGLRAFGPTQAAARLESSKAFAKALMARAGIPTAAYQVFADYEAAAKAARQASYPLVVKADGLAAGKGVTVAETPQQALAALHRLLIDCAFGRAGRQVLLEEFLEGEEASVLALCDGESVCPLLPAQDHKAVYDGDQGPNTGGMGAYAPAPGLTPALLDQVTCTILEPAVAGLRALGCPYRGVLYVGLMLTASGPRVLEFNCRLGDPETQAILPLLETDLVDLLEACVDDTLAGFTLRFTPGACVCVVLASAGYPGPCRPGVEIKGLEAVTDQQVAIFHAGTSLEGNRLVTAGGRVLGIAAWDATLPEAVARAYSVVAQVEFDGMHYRRDIGAKGLRAIEMNRRPDRA